jgi:hypothetical protein
MIMALVFETNANFSPKSGKNRDHNNIDSRFKVEPDLVRFGAAVSGPIWQLGRECEEQQPVLKKSNPWGKVVDFA